jgi:hypothetical protein
MPAPVQFDPALFLRTAINRALAEGQGLFLLDAQGQGRQSTVLEARISRGRLYLRRAGGEEHQAEVRRLTRAKAAAIRDRREPRVIASISHRLAKARGLADPVDLAASPHYVALVWPLQVLTEDGRPWLPPLPAEVGGPPDCPLCPGAIVKRLNLARRKGASLACDGSTPWPYARIFRLREREGRIEALVKTTVAVKDLAPSWDPRKVLHQEPLGYWWTPLPAGSVVRAKVDGKDCLVCAVPEDAGIIDDVTRLIDED